MKGQAKKIAVCGVMVALGVVILQLGNMLGLGIYLAPMLVGLCLAPVGRGWGVKYQLLLWLAIGLLSLILVANPEENLMFLGLFGWYPALRPILQKLPALARVLVKLLAFNASVVALETLLMLVLAPEAMGLGMVLLLLLLGNITFFVYDLAIPRFDLLVRKYLGRVLR